MSAEDVVADALFEIEWGTDVGATPEEMATLAISALRRTGLLNTEDVHCRKCGQIIEGEGFGSPKTGWEHPFSCPPNADYVAEFGGAFIVDSGMSTEQYLKAQHEEIGRLKAENQELRRLLGLVTPSTEWEVAQEIRPGLRRTYEACYRILNDGETNA